MDASFVGLFDPSDCNNQHRNGIPSPSGSDFLPPEIEEGNVEYKLKLLQPSRSRFEHLVTQMKWRLREGHGEAIYEIGVEDNGLLAGLSPSDMESSMNTLEAMAEHLGAATTIIRERLLDGDKKAAEVLVRRVPEDQQLIDLRVAVVGNVDAGKSTVVGVLTHGELDNGRGKARLNLFRHLHEIQSGHTSSISHEIMGFDSSGQSVDYSICRTAEEICETSSKLITFLDLAGHPKYLRTTVCGLTGYSPHFAMVVVSSNAGVVGTAREHLGLALALGVPIFVVVNKIDICQRTNPHVLAKTLEQLELLLKSPGCKKVPMRIDCKDDAITVASNMMAECVTPIFTVSCLTGQGLDLLMYFLNVLPACHTNAENDKLNQCSPEFQIDETFVVPGVGSVVGGLLNEGMIRVGDRLVLGPTANGNFHPVNITNMHRYKTRCSVVRAGQSATLALGDFNPNLIRRGMMIAAHDINLTPCRFFQATVCVLFHSTAICCGFQTTVHIGNVRQTAIVVGIMHPDKVVRTNERASVMFKFKHPEYLRPGFRLLFREGHAKGIGRVTQVFPIDYSVER